MIYERGEMVLWEVGGRAGCGSRVVSFTSSSTDFHPLMREARACLEDDSPRRIRASLPAR